MSQAFLSLAVMFASVGLLEAGIEAGKGSPVRAMLCAVAVVGYRHAMNLVQYGKP